MANNEYTLNKSMIWAIHAMKIVAFLYTKVT
jgi:hypothetical protein